MIWPFKRKPNLQRRVESIKRVDITRADINGADRYSLLNCPVARAYQRILPDVSVRVEGDVCVFTDASGCEYRSRMHKSMQQMIQRFDETGYMHTTSISTTVCDRGEAESVYHREALIVNLPPLVRDVPLVHELEPTKC